MKIKDLIEKLQRLNPEETIAHSLWISSDVYETAKVLGYQLTEVEINTVLNDIERHEDAEHGINWATIEIAIDNIIDNRTDGKTKPNTEKIFGFDATNVKRYNGIVEGWFHTSHIIGLEGSEYYCYLTTDGLVSCMEHMEYGEIGGLWLSGKTVTDYDGCSSIPKDILALLTKLDYDISSVS